MGLSSILGIINFCAICFAALFCVLSTATNNWQTLTNPDEINIGLWKQCNAITCYDDTKDGSLATRVLMIISCLCFAAVIIVHLTMCCVKSLSPKILTVILLLTFLFEIAAMACYTDKMKQDGADYGWSYHLGWVSAFLALITGVASFFATNRDE